MRSSYGFLLKPHLSIGNCKTNQWVFQGFCAICNTLTELTCERFAKSWTFSVRTQHGTENCCTSTKQLHCTFYDVCDFVSNWAAIDRRQEIVIPKCRASVANKALQMSHVICKPSGYEFLLTLGLVLSSVLTHSLYSINVGLQGWHFGHFPFYKYFFGPHAEFYRSFVTRVSWLCFYYDTFKQLYLLYKTVHIIPIIMNKHCFSNFRTKTQKKF